MASFYITETSPSECSGSSNVGGRDARGKSWTREVLGSFGHCQPPPPTYTIPRKEVNSTLIYTPTDARARQLSIVPSVSNDARLSVQCSNSHIRLSEEDVYENGSSSAYSPDSSSRRSPRMGMEKNLETLYQLSGLGRGSGSRRSEGSSIEVAVGGSSRSETLRASRQVFIRKESRINRGLRGVGPEYRVADSSSQSTPEAHGELDAKSPFNAKAKLAPRKLSIPGPEFQAKVSPTLPEKGYERRPRSVLPPLATIRPLFTPPNVPNHAPSPNPPQHAHTPRGLEIPGHSMHSPYIHHSPIPVLSDTGGSIHATSAVGAVDARVDWANSNAGWEYDLDNPRNWSLKRKYYNTVVSVMYTFAILFAGAVYLPAHEAMGAQFEVSSIATMVGFSLFILGLAFGPLLAIILSDIWGRRPIYGVALPLSCMFIMGAGLATNLGTVLICRFVAAIVASPAVAIGFFMIGDMWIIEETKFPTVMYVFVVCGSPYLGPIIGGFAVQYGKWQWAIWVSLIASGVIYMLSYFMSETHRTRIVRTRQRYLSIIESSATCPTSLGLEGTISDIRRRASQRLRRARASRIGRQNHLATIRNGFELTIVRTIKMLLFEPVVTIGSLYISFVSAYLFQTLVSVPLVFTKVYNFGLIESSFADLGILGGMFTSAMVLTILELTIHKRTQQRFLRLGGNVAPEEKLHIVLFGSILFPLGLLWWAWSAQKGIHWFLPILAGVLVGFAGLSVILGVTLYLQEIYPGDTFISVISATTTMGWLLGAIFALFTIPMYKHLNIRWAGSVMALISLSFMPLPWALWKWGRDLRAATKFEVNKFCEKERRVASVVV